MKNLENDLRKRFPEKLFRKDGEIIIMMQKEMVYFLKPDIWLGAFFSFVIPFGISMVFRWIHGVEGSESPWLGFVRTTGNRETIGHSPDVIFANSAWVLSNGKPP